jgi:hypothetical protein
MRLPAAFSATRNCLRAIKGGRSNSLRSGTFQLSCNLMLSVIGHFWVQAQGSSTTHLIPIPAQKLASGGTGGAA